MSALVVPEIILLNSLRSLLKLIKDDFNAQTDKSKTILYRVCEAHQLERYGFFQQAVKVFVDNSSEDSRKLDVNIFFNLQRATLPTIHITLPSEMPSQDGIGIDEGYQENDLEDEVEQQYRKVFTRRFDTRYNIVITSENSNEVVLIYHVIRALFIPMLTSLSVTGLENIKLGGGDLNLQGFLPPNVFARNIGLTFAYEVNARDLVDFKLITNLVVGSNIVSGETGPQEQPDYSNVTLLSRLIIGEIPSGTINGTNTLFTLANRYLSGSTMVYLNGQRITPENNDYSEIAQNQIEFTSPVEIGDVIRVDYIKLT